MMAPAAVGRGAGTENEALYMINFNDFFTFSERCSWKKCALPSEDRVVNRGLGWFDLWIPNVVVAAISLFKVGQLVCLFLVEDMRLVGTKHFCIYCIEGYSSIWIPFT